MMYKNATKYCLIGMLLVIFCLSPYTAEAAKENANGNGAAKLFIAPASGTFEIGVTFSTTINVSSKAQAMNAASGVISFPQDKLEVVSISKNKSIVSLWTEEPSFSNTEGKIHFEGIVLNPGFQGPLGRILTVKFTSKAIGEAVVKFSSGTVLANDGEGTNILSTLGAAKFNILQKKTNTQTAPSLPIKTIKPLKPRASANIPLITVPALEAKAEEAKAEEAKVEEAIAEVAKAEEVKALVPQCLTEWALLREVIRFLFAVIILLIVTVLYMWRRHR